MHLKYFENLKNRTVAHFTNIQSLCGWPILVDAQIAGMRRETSLPPFPAEVSRERRASVLGTTERRSQSGGESTDSQRPSASWEVHGPRERLEHPRSVCFCHFLEVGRVGPADGRNALDIDETSLSAQGLTVASQNPCAILPSARQLVRDNEQPGAVGVGKVAASPPIAHTNCRAPTINGCYAKHCPRSDLHCQRGDLG